MPDINLIAYSTLFFALVCATAVVWIIGLRSDDRALAADVATLFSARMDGSVVDDEVVVARDLYSRKVSSHI